MHNRLIFTGDIVKELQERHATKIFPPHSNTLHAYSAKTLNPVVESMSPERAQTSKLCYKENGAVLQKDSAVHTIFYCVKIKK